MSRISKIEGLMRTGMVHKGILAHNSLEHRILERSKFVDVAPGYVKIHYRFDVDRELNPMGFIHGGVTASLVDSVTTTCCCVARDGHAGVTADLSVSYLKGIDPLKHPVVTLIGRVDQSGRQLTFTSGEIRSEDEKVLFATGKQTKMMVNSPGPLTVLGIDIKALFEEK